MVDKLTLYHRHHDDLLDCYSSVCKSFNADQPLKDLSEEGVCVCVCVCVCVEKSTAGALVLRVTLKIAHI